MEIPLVSIITPSFNQGRFIEENLFSVNKQLYHRIEHIVVDGGSTDDTIEILRRHERTYNLRWISEPDQGHADAVNKGFAMAQGKILGWLNSDDVYFDRSTISAVVEGFQRYPDVDIVYGDVAFIWEDGTILRVQCLPRFSYNRLLRGCFLEQPAVFFKRHVLEAYKLNSSMKVAIDYEYWLRIGKLCYFHHIPRILAADRNHWGRISISEADKLKTVAAELRRQYVGKASVGLILKWQLDRVFSGIPRRVKGLMKLISLIKKIDFAFNAKLVINPRLIRNQLFPKGLERLRP